MIVGVPERIAVWIMDCRDAMRLLLCKHLVRRPLGRGVCEMGTVLWSEEFAYPGNSGSKQQRESVTGQERVRALREPYLRSMDIVVRKGQGTVYHHKPIGDTLNITPLLHPSFTETLLSSSRCCINSPSHNLFNSEYKRTCHLDIFVQFKNKGCNF